MEPGLVAKLLDNLAVKADDAHHAGLGLVLLLSGAHCDLALMHFLFYVSSLAVLSAFLPAAAVIHEAASSSSNELCFLSMPIVWFSVRSLIIVVSGALPPALPSPPPLAGHHPP